MQVTTEYKATKKCNHDSLVNVDNKSKEKTGERAYQVKYMVQTRAVVVLSLVFFSSVIVCAMTGRTKDAASRELS